MDLRVSELIDMENRCWNIHLLQQLFLPFEVEEIRSTPLSNSLPSDKQIWTGTSNGLFTVRSAYKLAMESYGISGVHLLRMIATYAIFGRNYGSYQFLIRLNIFYGMLAVIFFQLKQILCEERYYLMTLLKNVC